MMFGALLVLGAISYLNIPLELLPSGFTPPFLWVQVPTLPSAPTDVEERIGIPVEEMLSTVRNISEMGTRIDSDSASFMMEFEDGTDMDLAYNQVIDRLERVLPTLDNDVDQYFIWKYNPSDDPVSWLGLSVEEGQAIDDVLIERVLVPRVERIPGVTRVELWGVPDRVVTVEVDDRGAEAVGGGTFQLVQRMMRDNFSMAGGTIESTGRTYPLRIIARYESIDAIRDLPVGGGLRLDDVGEVYVEDRAERAIYRVNERQGIFLAIYKESTANTVDVSREVRETLRTIIAEDERLSGLTFHQFFDQGELIEQSLTNLQQTALWGGFFAIIVLIVFLRRIGMTILIAIAIPVSMLGTLVVMYFLGLTLNVLSLTGLMLSVGLVVDNSIVVVESIQRKQQDGMNKRQAAFHGAAEVALAILVATLTTVVVFLPLILMSGSETLSFYLSQIGLPVCVSLVSSLFVSLIFIPLASLIGLGDKGPARIILIEKLESAYVAALGWALRRRSDMALIAVTVFISMFAVSSQVPTTDQAEANINDFRIYIDFADGFQWEDRAEHLLRCEGLLYAEREELYIEDLLVRMGGRWGRPQLRSFLMDPEERGLPRDEIIERALALMPEMPGVQYSASWDSPASAQDTLTVRIVGPDTRRLVELSDEISRRIRTVEGVTSVQVRSDDSTDAELHFFVERERAERVGLSPFIVGSTLDYAVRGRRLPDFRTTDEDLPMFVQGDVSQSDELDEVQNLELPGLYDGVTLDNVTDVTVERSFRAIDREDRRTVLHLEIQTSREDIEELSADIDAVMASFNFPHGYSLEKGQRFDMLQDGKRERNFALTLAVVFVFLLMGVLFESFILPFSIVLSIPFAFVGVYWALFLTNTPMDLMAGVGLIILIGIVVNNAIVLVDLVGELRRQGHSRTEALLSAGHQRLRPILMTALTTIFGVVPMAMGTSSLVGIPYAPMGRAVIGGLVASTLLTLFVVPLFYTFFDDISQAGTRAVRRWAGWVR